MTWHSSMKVCAFGALAAGDGGERGVAGVADRLPVLTGDVGGAENAPANDAIGHDDWLLLDWRL